MQLTKLRAAPVRQVEVPPCAPVGGMDGGTASQLIRSVLRTLGGSGERAQAEKAAGGECEQQPSSRWRRRGLDVPCARSQRRRVSGGRPALLGLEGVSLGRRRRRASAAVRKRRPRIAGEGRRWAETIRPSTSAAKPVGKRPGLTDRVGGRSLGPKHQHDASAGPMRKSAATPCVRKRSRKCGWCRRTSGCS